MDFDHTPIAAAATLAQFGVPLFIAPASPSFPTGGSGDTGYMLPSGWQHTIADPQILDNYNPRDGLCAVMGKIVDAIDVDPRNGGTESLAKLTADGLLPTVYGVQSTPSGGQHLLIASLGVRSRDNLLPGIDVKAGVGGVGHGFIFLAPTRKVSKEDNKVHEYAFEVEPDLSALLLGQDDTGAGLAALINASRTSTGSGPSYDGPPFVDLEPDRAEIAKQYTIDTLYEWQVSLGAASGWEEGERDHRGRGWEALSRDAAWTVARLAVTPWTSLDEADAEDAYVSLLPSVIAVDPKCRGKWYEGILEKAAAIPVDQPPWWSEAFFERTEVLRHIEQAAHSRLVSPEGLLAAVLGRVLVEVPPSVMLPPSIGSAASLNLGISLVGNSGSGKSAVMDVSAELLGITGLNQASIEAGMGSGEGMIDLFLEPELAPNDKGILKPTGNSVLVPDPRCILMADEIDQMAAVGSDRQGSTLNSLLRTALTGGALKMANARAGGRSRSVEKRVYRMVVMVGVQPARSDVLLNSSETSMGTPHRFLWASMHDRTRPKQRPSWPGPLDWNPPSWPEWALYPDHVTDQILEARERYLDGKATQDEGHIVLTRLKLAFALAVLHGETKISDEWWLLAGTLVSRSLSIQAECRAHLSQELQHQEVIREVRRAKAQQVASEEVATDQLTRAVEALFKRLAKTPGEEKRWSDVKPAMRLREGLDTADVLSALVEAHPQVEVTEVEAQGRTSYRLTYNAES